jgi:YidC/Oxa1 family membrane protein insertase
MMNYFMPVMIFMASRSFPAGLALYWVIGNIFTVIQQVISKRSLGKVKEARK